MSLSGEYGPDQEFWGPCGRCGSYSMLCYDACYACGAQRPPDAETITAREAQEDVLVRARRVRRR